MIVRGLWPEEHLSKTGFEKVFRDPELGPSEEAVFGSRGSCFADDLVSCAYRLLGETS